MNANTNEASKQKFPYRLGFGLLFGLLGWLVPYLGVNSTLLPAKIQQIAPGQKVQIVATLATIAMIVATIANIIEGTLSDRTVSRIGKRNPWIILGLITTLIMFLCLTKVKTVRGIIINWSLFQVALNMMVAPIVAFIADKAPQEISWWGIGFLWDWDEHWDAGWYDDRFTLHYQY